MILLVFLIVCLTYGTYTVWKLKKQLHVLQLNSYMNDRYLRWLRQNHAKTWSFYELLPLFALVPMFLNLPISASLLWGGSYGLLLSMRQKGPDKKKLVFTQRATRLFAAMLAIFFILCIIGCWLLTSSDMLVVKTMVLLMLTLLSTVSFGMALGANGLMQPLENAINRRYYHDARVRIRQMPRLQTIGITGSFGKTSTKTIVTKILAERFHVLMTPESYNTPMGITKVIRSSLTPVHEIFVAEMGAKQRGDIRELCNLVSPKFGILTAIGEQHLETFKTLENIKHTKHELIESLPADGIAFLNMDNEHIQGLAPLTQVKKVFFGIDSAELHYSARNIRISSAGSSFDFHSPNGKQAVFHTKLLGRHNIYNILAASAVACELGIDVKTIASVVRTLIPVAHRLELKKTSQNITIIDDAFNSNPVGARSALEVLKGIEGKKKILISPGMVELGEREYEFNYEFGVQAATNCDYIILVGQQQTRPIQEALQTAGYESYYAAKNLTDANQHLWTMVQSGDVVLYENDLPDTYNE